MELKKGERKHKLLRLANEAAGGGGVYAAFQEAQIPKVGTALGIRHCLLLLPAGEKMVNVSEAR